MRTLLQAHALAAHVLCHHCMYAYGRRRGLNVNQMQTKCDMRARTRRRRGELARRTRIAQVPVVIVLREPWGRRWAYASASAAHAQRDAVCALHNVLHTHMCTYMMCTQCMCMISRHLSCVSMCKMRTGQWLGDGGRE